MRSPHICPNCGERVSGFASGCALCGAELDPKRAQGPRSISDRVRGLLATKRVRPGSKNPVR
jgi:predicted  nucleic acid-binding Zn-ribbon protein